MKNHRMVPKQLFFIFVDFRNANTGWTLKNRKSG